MQFKPLGYRVFAKRLWNPDIEVKGTDGRIITIKKPEMNKEIQREAVVVEKSDDVDSVNIGDHIIIGQYGKYEPPKFETDTNGKYKGCLIIREDDIMGKIIGGENGTGI